METTWGKGNKAVRGVFRRRFGERKHTCYLIELRWLDVSGANKSPEAPLALSSRGHFKVNLRRIIGYNELLNITSSIMQHVNEFRALRKHLSKETDERADHNNCFAANNGGMQIKIPFTLRRNYCYLVNNKRGNTLNINSCRTHKL